MTVGTQVEIQFGEPWDLVTTSGSGWFPGAVCCIASNHDSALISFNTPIAYAGRTVARLIAMPRYTGQSFAPTTKSIICGFIAADDSMVENFADLDPRAMTSWFSALGTLKVTHI